jgi:predicted PurR-regulated permease PerM
MPGTNHTRRRISIVFLIALGLIFGLAIKKVTFGLLLGLLIGVMAGGLKRK